MLQMWLGYQVAEAVGQTSSCSSDLTPSLGTSICHGCLKRPNIIICAIQGNSVAKSSVTT